MLTLKKKDIVHRQGRGMLTCMVEKMHKSLTEISLQFTILLYRKANNNNNKEVKILHLQV